MPAPQGGTCPHGRPLPVAVPRRRRHRPRRPARPECSTTGAGDVERGGPRLWERTRHRLHRRSPSLAAWVGPSLGRSPGSRCKGGPVPVSRAGPPPRGPPSDGSAGPSEPPPSWLDARCSKQRSGVSSAHVSVPSVPGSTLSRARWAPRSTCAGSSPATPPTPSRSPPTRPSTPQRRPTALLAG